MPYPARLRAEEVAEILGFAENDIPVLARNKKLKPLGKPTQQATKYYSRDDILEKSTNLDWLQKSTQVIYDYWGANNAKKRKAA